MARHVCLWVATVAAVSSGCYHQVYEVDMVVEGDQITRSASVFTESHGNELTDATEKLPPGATQKVKQAASGPAGRRAVTAPPSTRPRTPRKPSNLTHIASIYKVDPAAPDLVTPEARAQTDPVPHGGDAADDPAIWLHPTDPTKSLILGTDKQGGLLVYDMDGKQLQLVSRGCKPDNVDVLYGFKLGDNVVDLAVASVRPSKSPGVMVWRIDPSARRLTDVTAGGTLAVFGGTTPYGVCTYRSAKTGKRYFFVNNKAGKIEQHELRDAGDGTVKAVKVRQLKVGSVTEGCVADDELGRVYFAEEAVGIWRFPAEPDGGVKGKLVAKVGEHGLAADVEGLTIYGASDGRGYLIASSQGNNTFKVYTRQGDNRFLLTIDPKAGRIDDVNDTDGIAVTNRPTSKQFPAGFLIVQDGSNASGKQNFKLYDWRDIAGTRLLIDTKSNPDGR